MCSRNLQFTSEVGGCRADESRLVKDHILKEKSSLIYCDGGMLPTLKRSKSTTLTLLESKY